MCFNKENYFSTARALDTDRPELKMLSAAGTLCISSYPQEFWTVSAEGSEIGKYVTQVCPLKYWRKRVPELQLAWHAVGDTGKMLWIQGLSEHRIMWCDKCRQYFFFLWTTDLTGREKSMEKHQCINCSCPELGATNSLMSRVKFCQKEHTLWHCRMNRHQNKEKKRKDIK